MTHDAFLAVVRGIVRPVVTLMAMPAIIWFVYLQIVGVGHVPTEWWAFVSAMFAWWFWDRSRLPIPPPVPPEPPVVPHG